MHRSGWQAKHGRRREESSERDRAGTSQPCRGGTASQGQFPRGGRYQ